MTHSHARAAVRGESFTSTLQLLMVLLFLPMIAFLILSKETAARIPFVSVITQMMDGGPALPSNAIFDAEQAMGPSALMRRWDGVIADAARRFDVSESWIRAVMRQESGGRTVLDGDKPITSRAGAVGIMQLEPGTYEEMRLQYGLGADPFNARDNVYAGAAYLKWLHRKYGFPGMFAAYNGGPGTYENYVARGAPLPAETVNYVASVTAMLGGVRRLRGAEDAAPG